MGFRLREKTVMRGHDRNDRSTRSRSHSPEQLVAVRIPVATFQNRARCDTMSCVVLMG
jgi:hypothetical protein